MLNFIRRLFRPKPLIVEIVMDGGTLQFELPRDGRPYEFDFDVEAIAGDTGMSINLPAQLMLVKK